MEPSICLGSFLNCSNCTSRKIFKHFFPHIYLLKLDPLLRPHYWLGCYGVKKQKYIIEITHKKCNKTCKIRALTQTSLSKHHTFTTFFLLSHLTMWMWNEALIPSLAYKKIHDFVLLHTNSKGEPRSLIFFLNVTKVNSAILTIDVNVLLFMRNNFSKYYVTLVQKT